MDLPVYEVFHENRCFCHVCLFLVTGLLAPEPIDMMCFVFQQPQQGQRMATAQQQITGPKQQPMPTLTTLPQPVLNGGAPTTQQIVIRPQQPGVPGTQSIIIRHAVPAQTPASTVSDGTNTNNQQEKANKIIAEAIAKAQKSGKTSIPKVIQPPDLPAPLEEMDSLEDTPGGGKKKKKRKYTPKKDKDKEKTPKEKKKKKEKVKKVEVEIETADNSEASVGGNLPSVLGVNSDDLEDSKLEIDESEEEKPKKVKKKKPKKEPSEKTPKPEKKKPKKYVI